MTLTSNEGSSTDRFLENFISSEFIPKERNAKPIEFFEIVDLIEDNDYSDIFHLDETAVRYIMGIALGEEFSSDGPFTLDELGYLLDSEESLMSSLLCLMRDLGTDLQVSILNRENLFNKFVSSPVISQEGLLRFFIRSWEDPNFVDKDCHIKFDLWRHLTRNPTEGGIETMLELISMPPSNKHRAAKRSELLNYMVLFQHPEINNAATKIILEEGDNASLEQVIYNSQDTEVLSEIIDRAEELDSKELYSAFFTKSEVFIFEKFLNLWTTLSKSTFSSEITFFNNLTRYLMRSSHIVEDTRLAIFDFLYDQTVKKGVEGLEFILELSTFKPFPFHKREPEILKLFNHSINNDSGKIIRSIIRNHSKLTPNIVDLILSDYKYVDIAKLMIQMEMIDDYSAMIYLSKMLYPNDFAVEVLVNHQLLDKSSMSTMTDGEKEDLLSLYVETEDELREILIGALPKSVNPLLFHGFPTDYLRGVAEINFCEDNKGTGKTPIDVKQIDLKTLSKMNNVQMRDSVRETGISKEMCKEILYCADDTISSWFSSRRDLELSLIEKYLVDYLKRPAEERLASKRTVRTIVNQALGYGGRLNHLILDILKEGELGVAEVVILSKSENEILLTEAIRCFINKASKQQLTKMLYSAAPYRIPLGILIDMIIAEGVEDLKSVPVWHTEIDSYVQVLRLVLYDKQLSNRGCTIVLEKFLKHIEMGKDINILEHLEYGGLQSVLKKASFTLSKKQIDLLLKLIQSSPTPTKVGLKMLEILSSGVNTIPKQLLDYIRLLPRDSSEDKHTPSQRSLQTLAMRGYIPRSHYREFFSNEFISDTGTNVLIKFLAWQSRTPQKYVTRVVDELCARKDLEDTWEDINKHEMHEAIQIMKTVLAARHGNIVYLLSKDSLFKLMNSKRDDDSFAI